MKQPEYAQFLAETEEYGLVFATQVAHDIYHPSSDMADCIEDAMDPNSQIFGPDTLIRYLPALLDRYDAHDVMQRIHTKRKKIFSLRDCVRQALKHLELLHSHATTEQLHDLFAVLLNPGAVGQSSKVALECADQFAKVVRVLDTESTAQIVTNIWDTVCRYRALAKALAFTGKDALPAYLDRAPIAEQCSADIVRSDVVVPTRHIDPTDRGLCANAEISHTETLDPEERGYGMCTLLEADDGTPVGSVKWNGYPSMLGLRTVIDSRGRHTILPGVLYKIGGAMEHRSRPEGRFARVRPQQIQVQPARALGDFWPGSPSYEDYRAIIAAALQRPEFAKQ